MTRFLGPVLNIRNATPEFWHLSVLVVEDAAPANIDWQVGDKTGISTAAALWTRGTRTAWCYELLLPRIAVNGRYRLDGIDYAVAIPESGADPRCVYISCNGFSDPTVMAKHKYEKTNMWRNIAGRIGRETYHLLIAGGDQVYADSLLHKGGFKEWEALSFDNGNAAPLTPDMAEALQDFYFDLYCDNWSDTHMAKVMASVPMLAMWDDHDIIDGWGSHPTARQECAVMVGIFNAARRGFAVFQQHLESFVTRYPDGIGDCFSRGLLIGSTAILALDMRSERQPNQVMLREHWDKAVQWMAALDPAKVKHLLLLSSIPVAYPSFSLLEDVLATIPGQQELEDDLRDHWNSVSHAQERIRLIHQLIALSVRNIRPTILSGDVHVAALGQIESTRDPTRVVTINQLISSAVIHPPPPALAAFALGFLFDKAMELDTRITVRMAPFPGTRSRMIARRNYMVLEPDNQNRIWANWIVEGEDSLYTKVIHPLC
ncbi:alkaline phosphatase D family protein [Niveispirillum sp. KHB5.9]|uniref:alkaline phosphatase D family protein n=1 Tax=Niveispirillum sp. KHB5.9 TaxID=3400269 RepID=UPI003A863493